MKISEKKFRVSSVIENLSDAGMADSEVEKTEITPDGFLYSEGGKYRISYVERGEGGEVSTEISIEGESIEVVRTGAIESKMLFCVGMTHSSLYKISPYTFDVKVYTKKIRNTLTEDGGKIDIFYNMEIGGADKSVRMSISLI